MTERQFQQIVNTMDRENIERIIARQVQYAGRETTTTGRQYYLDVAMALFQELKQRGANDRGFARSSG